MKKYILLLLVCLVMSCSDSYLDKTHILIGSFI